MKKIKTIIGIWTGCLVILTLIMVTGANAQFKVGVLMAATGVYAPLGGASKAGALLAIDRFNEKGGFKGEKIDIIFEDYEGDPAKAITLGKKLIDEKVMTILCGGNTVGTLAVRPLTEHAKIPQINVSPRSPVTAEDIVIGKFYFQTVHENEVDAQKIGDYVKGIGAKKAAILYDSNQYGTSGAMYQYDYFKKVGIEVVLREKYQKGDRDLTPLLMPARKAGAEAVVVWGTLPTPAIIAKNIRDMGWKVQMIGSVGMGSPKMIELAGDAAEGVLFTSALKYGKPLPGEKVLIEAHQAKYGKPPSYFTALGWDAALLLIEAIKMTGGSKDSLKIRDAIENIKGLEGACGVYNMSSTDHAGLSKDSLHIIQIKGGKWFPLD
jgi:branched-chain amino acid transport system substrate-binding protein